MHKTIDSSYIFPPHASRETNIKPSITYSSHKSSLKILTSLYWILILKKDVMASMGALKQLFFLFTKIA